MAEKNNIRKFRNRIHINLGMVFFAVLFIYLLVVIYMYFTSDHIVGYRVQRGTLSTNSVYQGIALREEETFTASDGGYINYYAREGTKVAYGDMLYSIDPTGTVSDYIAENVTADAKMEKSDLNQIKSDIKGFISTYDSMNFDQTYELKTSVQNTVIKIATSDISSIASLNSQGVSFVSATKPGVISFCMDGYESLTPDAVTADILSKANYTKTQINNNDSIDSNGFSYKLCTSENWMIVIQCDAAYAAQLVEEGYLNVKFMKNQETSWAQVIEYHNADGNTYIGLAFNNSMIAFCTDRFVSIEILMDEEAGLKIPNTSIVEKEFFLIPEKYILKGDNTSTEYGVLKLTYNEDGSRATEYIDTGIYSYQDGYYYMDDTILRAGDQLCAPDSLTDVYAISQTATLIGVYNINKGYADFKQITILSQNDEYAIVQSGTEYGLSVYDYIVLDAKAVNEDDFIYE